MADPKRKDPLAAAAPPLAPLYKQRSWSPDIEREEAWQRRKGLYRNRRREAAGRPHRLSRSVTDEDLEELRGCIDLGFGFGLDSPVSSATASSDDADRLSDTLPALDLYYAVQRTYSGNAVGAAPAGDMSEQPSAAASPGGSPLSIYSPGDSPHQVKRRLKQWAQVVACSVRQHLP